MANLTKCIPLLDIVPFHECENPSKDSVIQTRKVHSPRGGLKSKKYEILINKEGRLIREDGLAYIARISKTVIGYQANTVDLKPSFKLRMFPIKRIATQKWLIENKVELRYLSDADGNYVHNERLGLTMNADTWEIAKPARLEAKAIKTYDEIIKAQKRLSRSFRDEAQAQA